MNRIVSIAMVIVGISFASPVLAAGVSEANFTAQGSQTYSSVPVSAVEVFVYKPDFKFKVIGVIEARGMYSGASLGDLFDLDKWTDTNPIGEKEDIALAMKALKEEAARVGADGVIIINSRQIRVSQDGSTERRINAAAIRRQD
jgi:hypothetical protein